MSPETRLTTSVAAAFAAAVLARSSATCAANIVTSSAELGDRHRMSLAQLHAFFVNVRSAVRAYGRDHIHFVWHGGEPFLIPLEYYEQVGALQREVFGGDGTYSNLVQSNLTVLTERHVAFLREHRFFTHTIGVSFDVYGDQRLDTQGRLRTQTVLANLQRLRDEGISFGAITVLARNTLSHVEAIYRFYDSLGLSVRFLPFYKSASDAQVAQHSLNFHQITRSFKASATRAQAVAEARERMTRYCTSCPYFGYCPGRFAAEATVEQRRMLATDGCPVRELVKHIIQRLQGTCIAEQMARERGTAPSEPSALAVDA
jgi:sulfatase maturation enzyme AslB (radical SAM superfamily)